MGQVLLGSLAYLVPVLPGLAPRLGRNLGRMQAHPWLPLVAANLAALAYVLGLGRLAAAATLLWVVDFALRAARSEWRGEPAPEGAA